MIASSFIFFSTYTLRQNGIRFHKGYHITFEFAPDLKKITIYLPDLSKDLNHVRSLEIKILLGLTQEPTKFNFPNND